jgi:Uma2 family endonuclease
MSVAPRFPSDIGYAGLRMTADDYLSLGETHERYELIDGVVVMMSPSPSAKHQELIYLILSSLGQWDHARKSLRVFPDADLRLADHLVYRPDISVYMKASLPKGASRLTTPPELIIEVLSPGSRPIDLITKRDDYERFGVPEYWAIDPDTLRVRAWRRQGARLVELAPSDDQIDSTSIPGFSLDLASLRREFADE